MFGTQCVCGIGVFIADWQIGTTHIATLILVCVVISSFLPRL